MKRLLIGVFARVDRAQKHLADLKRHIQARRYEDSEPIEDNLVPFFAPLPNPIEISGFEFSDPHLGILIGETVYNLRSALDYLIYALARLDSGQFQDGTQFPIEDTPQGFAGKKTRGFLKGINAAHEARIEALQPYNGCHWTKLLRDISNPDKHRHLVRLRGIHTLHIRSHPSKVEAPPGSAAKPSGMDVEGRRTFAVAFDDRTSIIDTLEVLKSQVAQMLDAFKPEFK